MQTPDEGNVICANDFHDFLKDLHPCGQDPIFVLGNHDVRRKGVLRNRSASSSLVPAFNTRIEWIPDHPVGILCWNSADGGRMARGKITGEQYRIIEERLPLLTAGNVNPILISLLHHHPLQFRRIDPEMRRFHMKTLGASLRKFIGFAYEHMDGLTNATGICPLLRLPWREGNPSRPQTRTHRGENTRTPAGKPTDPHFRMWKFRGEKHVSLQETVQCGL